MDPIIRGIPWNLETYCITMNDPTLVFCSLGGLFLVTYVIPSIIKAGADRVKVSHTELLRGVVFIFFSQLSAIPTVGYSGLLTSYIGAVKFFFNARELIQEGYRKVSSTP
jgi:apolipoprotein N-acyltransferase